VVVAMAAGNNSSREAAAGTAAMPAAPAVNGAGSSGVSASVQQLQQGLVRRPQGSQRFFVGHSAFVCCLALGRHGTLLATGQEGKAALIRVWDFAPGQQQQRATDREPTEDNCAASNNSTCLAVLCGEYTGNSWYGSVACSSTWFPQWELLPQCNSHTCCSFVDCDVPGFPLHVLSVAAHASRLAALDVSADGRALVAAGCDEQGRQVIALWDISGIRQGARVSWRLASKAVCLKFFTVHRALPGNTAVSDTEL
jgi:WD40 repeat protein